MQVINIISLIALSKISEGSLVLVAIIFGASTLFVNVLSTFHIIKGRDYLRPSLRSYNKGTIPDICKTGLQFFIIQIMCLLMFTMDNLIISHYFGPNAVTSFSIANKIYNTGYSFIAAFLVPYWSGTTSAIERGDTEWIRRSIKKTTKILFAFIVGSVIVTVLFRQITFMWLHKELEYGTGIPALMCVFYVLYSILAIECQFINGTGMLKIQLIMYLILGIGNVPLSILMGVNMGMQAFGVRLATTILVFIAVIVLGINLKMILEKIEKRKMNHLRT